MSLKSTKIVCVFDGFGLTTEKEGNAIAAAKLPIIRSLFKDYPWITLDADGSAVGQETGLVGNSEVGHMNIGGLQLVPQLSYQITQSAQEGFEPTKAIKEQNINPIELLKKAFKSGKNKNVHLVGLFSKGTIHSDLRHWVGSIEAAGNAGAERIIMHIISDGRDSDPKSLLATWNYFVTEFSDRLSPFENIIKIGSVGGRFFSMDRDNNWDRVALGILPMLDYKIIDNSDQGDHNAVKSYLENTYSINLSSSLQALQSSLIQGDAASLNYNDHQWRETQVFFDSEDKKDRKNGKSPLTVDLDIVLGVVTHSAYKISNYDETLFPTGIYYNDALAQQEGGVINQRVAPPYGIKKHDIIWGINFRTDRFRQLFEMLIKMNRDLEMNWVITGLNEYGITAYPALTSMENFDADRGNNSYYALFSNKPVQNTLSDYISAHGKTQLHIAETEKYNHVTYFFNGGQNKKNRGEDWKLVESNKVSSHALKPEMKAEAITDIIVECVNSEVTLEVCKYEDLEVIRSMIKEYWQNVETEWHKSSSISSNQYEATMNIVYSDILPQSISEGLIWFINYRGHRVGIVQIGYYPEDSELFIYDLYIVPEYQSRGIGTRVINHFQYQAHQLGYERIGLWVDTKNEGAKKLYHKCGFEYTDMVSFQWYNADGTLAHTNPAEYLSYELSDKSNNKLSSKPLNPVLHYDYIIVNYANPDMVGHTGDFEASVKSLEALDAQFGRLLELVKQSRCQILLTADHGNAEIVGHVHHKGKDEVDTKHNDNPVPCIMIGSETKDQLINTLKDQQHGFLSQMLNIDYDTMRKGLASIKSVDIMHQANWFNDKNMLKPKLPLWYAGVLLLFLQ